MGKRLLPFGYNMENGEIKPEPEAQGCVNWIFNAYLMGASLNDIAEHLNRGQRPRYDKDKPWNKNMISRILKDQRYCGNHQYPEIIPQSLYETIQRQMASRILVPQQTEVQKAICDLSGVKSYEGITTALLDLLNRLIVDPHLIHSPVHETVEQIELFRTRRDLEDAISQQPVDEELASQLIYKQAELEYAILGDEEYETEKLRRFFAKSDPIKELSADMLRQTVARISVDIKCISVTLKNNQIIEVGDLS